jgi:hypothetical protein
MKRVPSMTLTTEELGEIPKIGAARLQALLTDDAFGKFAVLSASDDLFMQAGNDWQPGKACAAFLRAHDSDPWVLEYREGSDHFRAVGHVTLAQIREAFASYLAGNEKWRSAFEWTAVEA